MQKGQAVLVKVKNMKKVKYKRYMAIIKACNLLKKNDTSDVYVEKLQKLLIKESLGVSLIIEKNAKTGNYCIKQKSVYWAWFAKDFTGGLVKSLSKNVLIPQSATLSQVVRWTSEEGQETWVPLFRIEFKRM